MINIDIVQRYIKQPSTQKGVALVTGALGAFISPELIESFIAAVMAVIGFIDIYRDER